jgi:RHS repeat-associated protein
MLPSPKNTTPFGYSKNVKVEEKSSYPFRSYPKPQISDLEVWSAYPFGSILSSVSKGVYMYGFQGQEKINEIYGEGYYVDYTYRGYNPRVGRFFAVDPLAAKYPYYSSYQFSGNRVIDMIELEGLEPTESGSYGGQGAIAPKLDEKGNAVEGTENQRWTWNNDAWNSTKIGVTQNELTTLFPKGNSGLLKTMETTLNLESSTYGIASQTELNSFIAQTGFETAGFTKLTENLNYSLAGLRANFKRLDKYSDEYLNEVRTDANKLAVLLYGGSGNGIDYRGRGLIHTTWEGNYKKASDSYNKMYGTNYDFTKNPTLLSTDHQIAVRSALIFFKTNGLFGMSNFNINDVSKKVNFYDKKSFTKRSALFDKVNSVIK